MTWPVVLTELPKRTETHNQIRKFYVENYEVADHLMPTPHDLNNPKLMTHAAIAKDGEWMAVSSILMRSPNLAEIQRTVVGKLYRGIGMSNDVFTHQRDLLYDRGFRKIACEVYADNLRMLHVRMKQGFRIEGCHHDHDAPGVDEYTLGLTL